MKKVLLYIFFILCTASVYPDIFYTSAAGDSMTISVDISADTGINELKLNFDLYDLKNQNITDTDAEYRVFSDAAAEDIEPGNYILTEGSIDTGYLVALKVPGFNPDGFYLRNNAQGAADSEEFSSSDTLHWEFTVSNLSEIFTLAYAVVTVNSETIPADNVNISIAGFSLFNGIKIQDASHTDFSETIATYADPLSSDIKRLYCYAYNDDSYVGAVEAQWSITGGDWDDNDLYISESHTGALIDDSILFNPDNAGSNGVIEAKIDFNFSLASVGDFSDTFGSLYSAGPFYEIAIVKTADNPDYTDDALGDTQLAENQSLTLHAAEYDSSLQYRKMAGTDASWNIESSTFTGGGGSLDNGSAGTTGPSVTYTPPDGQHGSEVIKVTYGTESDSLKVTIPGGTSPVPFGIRISASGAEGAQILKDYFLDNNGEDLALSAESVDSGGVPIELIDVTWTTPSSWTNHELIGPDTGKTNTFRYNDTPGYSEIKITHDTLGSYTGNVTVLAAPEGVVYDIVHVIDHSGSMRQKAYSASDSPPKMTAVQNAVDYFVNIMDDENGNRYGLVIFDDQRDTLVPSGGTAMPFYTPSVKADLINNIIPSITADGNTTIGGGLLDGLDLMPDSGSRNQAILLLTDGRHNSPPSISSFVSSYNSRVNKFPVHIIGLGYDVGYQSSQLADLLSDINNNGTLTHLESHEELPVKLFKIFNQILLDTADQQTINDPVIELRADSEPVKIPVELSADVVSAEFSAFWSGLDDAADISLITPDGFLIEEDSINNRIRTGKHDRYKFFELRFPLSGIPDQHAGKWVFIITPAAAFPADKKILLTASISAETDLTMSAEISSPTCNTGDKVFLSADLERFGKPVKNVTVKAVCVRPTNSYANILSATKILNPKSAQSLNPVFYPYPQALESSIIDSQIHLIEKLVNNTLIKKSSSVVRLYDDGKHNDGAANDGRYSNVYDETVIPGNYEFTITASDIPVGSGRTTCRESNKSLYCSVKFNFADSIVSKKLISQNAFSRTYRFEFIPKDRLGNYLGPGYPLSVFLPDSLKIPGSLNFRNFTDNLDGSYSIETTFKIERSVGTEQIDLFLTPAGGEERQLRSFKLSDVIEFPQK